MTDTNTTAHIPDEAVQAAMDACKNIDWVQGLIGTSLSGREVITDAIAAALPYLSAPCAVEAVVLDDASLQAQISEIGNQIHNLSCEYQNNEPLSERLQDLRGKLWDISKRTAKHVDVLTPAEAVFGLLGWLTSRNETVALGSSHGAAIGAELAAEFCKVNNLGDCRDSFPKNLKHPTTTASQPVDVAAVRRQAFEEGFENGVEQSLNALDAYDDITRNEAEQGIRKLKPDYRALSVEPAQCQTCRGHGTKDYAGFAIDACDCISDDAAVDSFARLMKSKLAKKRREGRGGWQGMSADELTEILRQHVDKGDPVDVANLCMMLSENGQSIAPYLPDQFKDVGMIKKETDKQTCPFCGRPSIDQCAMRDWAWYPCDWEKALKGQQHDN